MAEAYQLLQIQLNDVRIARAALAQPYPAKVDKLTGKVGKPSYHVDIILNPTDPQLVVVQELMRKAIVNKFKDEAPIAQQQIVANNKLPLHRGDIDRAGKPEYAGKLYLSANNNEQPTIVVTDSGVNIATRGTPEVLTPSHPKYPYSGCFANVILNFYAYNYEGIKGVSAKVTGVQFYKHGEPLRQSSVSAVTEFGLVPEQADGAPPVAAQGASGGLL